MKGQRFDEFFIIYSAVVHKTGDIFTKFLTHKTEVSCNVFKINRAFADGLTLQYLRTVSWWRHQMETFPRYWPFVRGIHWSPVNSPQKVQWRWVFMFYLICTWTNSLANNGDAGDSLQWHHNERDGVSIISLTIVYSTVYSGADQGKHKNFASLAFVRGIYRWPVNSPHKGSVTRKMFPFDDVIINISPLQLIHYSRLLTHYTVNTGIRWLILLLYIT